MDRVILFTLDGEGHEIPLPTQDNSGLNLNQRTGLTLVSVDVIRDVCMEKGIPFEFIGVEPLFDRPAGVP